MLGGGGAATLSWRARAEAGTTRWRLAWRGVDERGSFTGQSREAEAPGSLDEQAAHPPSLAGVTRAGAYVMIPAEEGWRIYWAPSGGPFTLLRDHDFGTFAQVRAVARGDGRAALVVLDAGTERLFDDGPDLSEAPFQVRQTGGWSRVAAIARGADGSATMVVSTPAGDGLRLLPPSPALPSDLPGAGALVACTGARAADALDVATAAGPFVVPDDPGRLGGAWARTDLEVSAGGTCVRTIELWPRDRVASARLTAAADGTFTGTVEIPDGRIGARCRLEVQTR